MIDRFTQPLIALMFAMGVATGLILAALLGGIAGVPWMILLVAGVIAELVVLVVIALYIRRASGVIDSLSKGIQGEQAVAECLQTLLADGYEILHDLPFDNTLETGPNIDHVAIGPGGIFTIETKYRSKGDGEQITFDGHRLTIGSATNTNAIGQTIGNAKRIAEILKQVTGRRVKTQPALVFVGKWWVEDTRPKGGKNDIWVVNDKTLISWIRKAPPTLSREDTTLYIARLREYAHAPST